MSWGYEQRNTSFFRVKALKGKTQVIIQEVLLAEDKVEDVSGMSRYASYNKDDYKIVEHSFEIKDNEKGMIKKVLGDNKKYPCLSMSNYGNAFKYHGEKIYESWSY